MSISDTLKAMECRLRIARHTLRYSHCSRRYPIHQQQLKHVIHTGDYPYNYLRYSHSHRHNVCKLSSQTPSIKDKEKSQHKKFMQHLIKQETSINNSKHYIHCRRFNMLLRQCANKKQSLITTQHPIGSFNPNDTIGTHDMINHHSIVQTKEIHKDIDDPIRDNSDIQSTNYDTQWMTLEQYISDKGGSAHTVKHLLYVCKSLTSEYHKAHNQLKKNGGNCFTSIKLPQLTKIWQTILIGNQSLFRKMTRHSYYIHHVLTIFMEMINHQVLPRSNYKALCDMDISHNALVTATSQKNFYICGLRMGLTDTRIANLVLSRASYGDFSAYLPSTLVAQLQYVMKTVAIDEWQLHLFIKPLHRHLALGQLTCNDKLELGTLYAKIQKKHFTFVKIISTEIQEQLKIEFLLYQNIIKDDILFKRYAYSIRDVLQYQFCRMSEKSLPSGNITKFSSVTLSSTEKKLIVASHHEYLELVTNLRHAIHLLSNQTHNISQENKLFILNVFEQWRQRHYTLLQLCLLCSNIMQIHSFIAFYQFPLFETCTVNNTSYSHITIQNGVLYLLYVYLNDQFGPKSVSEIVAVARLLPSLYTLQNSTQMSEETGNIRFKAQQCILKKSQLEDLMYWVISKFLLLTKHGKEITIYHGCLTEEIMRWFKVPYVVDIKQKHTNRMNEQMIKYKFHIPQWFTDTATLDSNALKLHERPKKFAQSHDAAPSNEINLQLSPLCQLGRCLIQYKTCSVVSNFCRFASGIIQLKCRDASVINSCMNYISVSIYIIKKIADTELIYMQNHIRGLTEENIRLLLPVIQIVNTPDSITKALMIAYQERTKYKLHQPWNHVITRVKSQTRKKQLYKKIG